jgi:hypothetical protein
VSKFSSLDILDISDILVELKKTSDKCTFSCINNLMAGVVSTNRRRRRQGTGFGSWSLKRYWFLLLVVVILCVVSIPLAYFSFRNGTPTAEQDSYMMRFASESHGLRRGTVPDAWNGTNFKRDYSKMTLPVRKRSRHHSDESNNNASAFFESNSGKYDRNHNELLELPHPDFLPKNRRFPVLARPPSGHLGVVIVIYVGRMLPSYFHAFALSVERSGSQLKWLVFVTDAHSYGDYYENIEVVRMPEDELYERVARIDPEMKPDYARYLISNAPYALVELKPCLATIFEVELKVDVFAVIDRNPKFYCNMCL